SHVVECKVQLGTNEASNLMKRPIRIVTNGFKYRQSLLHLLNRGQGLETFIHDSAPPIVGKYYQFDTDYFPEFQVPIADAACVLVIPDKVVIARLTPLLFLLDQSSCFRRSVQ